MTDTLTPDVALLCAALDGGHDPLRSSSGWLWAEAGESLWPDGRPRYVLGADLFARLRGGERCGLARDHTRTVAAAVYPTRSAAFLALAEALSREAAHV